MDTITATEQFSSFLKEAKTLRWRETPKFKEVVLWGMGEEALVVGLAKRFLKHLRVYTITDGTFPSFVNEQTLVIFVAYHGNTEALNKAYDMARVKNCPILIINSDGKLAERALQDNVPRIRPPSNLPTQAAFPFLFIPIIQFFSTLGGQPLDDHIDRSRIALSSEAIERKAKSLAESMKGKTPLIYATPSMEAIGRRWKSQINKHAKIHAFFATVPEFLNNEIEGFASSDDSYYVILLEDEQDSVQTKQLVSTIKTFIRDEGIGSTEIAVSGKSLLVRSLTALYLGDLISLALASLQDVDPTQTPMRTKLHQELKWMSTN